MTSTTTTASSTHAFPLKFPFETADGTRIGALTLRRARAKDILALEAEAKRSGSNTAVTLTFLASVNDLKLEDIENIDAEDMIDLSEVVLNFLPEKLLKAGLKE